MSVVPGRQKIGRGEIILTAKPFIYILNVVNRGLCCDHCLKRKNGLQRCSGCSRQWYCNKDCQRGSWDMHRFECKNLKRIYPLDPPDAARLLARAVFKLKNGGDKTEETIDERRTRNFQDLMDHHKDITEDEKRYEHFLSLVVVLHKYIGDENLPTETDLLSIFGRICINSFNINDDNLNPVGTGLYLAASIFDHSCEPNAFVTFDSTALTVRSLIDWKTIDWNKIRISYNDVMNTTEDRLKELHQRYYFWCDCNHCHDMKRDMVMSSIVCGNKACTAPVYIDVNEDVDVAVGPCSECGYSDFEPSTRSRYYEVLKFSQEEIKTMENNNCFYLDICKKILELQENIFHKLNVWQAKALDCGFEAAIGVNMFEIAKKFGIENVDAIKFYYGEQHPSYGMILLKIGKICDFLGDIKESLYYLQQAEPILGIGLGSQHPAYRELYDLQHKVLEEVRCTTIQEKSAKGYI